MNKRIIFLIGTLQLGGAEKHLATILPLLSKKGWQVQLVTLFSKGPLADVLTNKNIPFECILSDREINFIQALPRILKRLIRLILTVIHLGQHLRKNKPEILHCFLPEPYILGTLAARIVHFPGFLVMSRRSLNFYQKKSVFIAWLEKKLHNTADAIVGNSQAILEQLKNEEDVPKEKLHLIYNGVDYDLYNANEDRQNIRSGLNIGKNDWAMIMVANLIPYKGHLDLLMALNLIKDQLPNNWRLLCVGKDREDNFATILREKSGTLGLNEHVKWLGSRMDVPQLLRASDVGILCSHEEGFSNAILETMAAGLPMVVTNVGGNKEAVVEGETAYIVPSKHPQALSEAILKLSQDRENALRMGEKARQRAQEIFSLEACIKGYENLYCSLIKAKEQNN